MSDSESYKLTKNLLGQLYNEAEEDISSKSSSPLYDSIAASTQRYQSPELFGSGAMKRVYKVYDSKTHRSVAMAKLKNAELKKKYDPFLREAILTSCLDHPNIIKVFDVGVDDDNEPYFTMDLKVGDSLETLLKEKEWKRTSLKEYLEIFLKICDAIAYAHSQGILHLDLKPDNIQVGHFGEVLVCDWGLGKNIGIETDDELEYPVNPDLINRLTLHGEIKGTPGYMAPEQSIIEGEKTKQTDIYALGCILYSVLCGFPPLSGSVMDILQKTKLGDIRMPRDRFPKKNLPASLDAVVRKAMYLKPEGRYESVGELSEDIRKYLTGYATHAEDASFLKEFKFFFKRNLAINLTAVFSLSLIIVLSFIFVLEINQQKNNALEALERAKKATDLYSQEKQNVGIVSQEYSNFLLEQDNFFPKKIGLNNIIKAYNKAVERVDHALLTDPDKLELWQNKIQFCLISQRFEDLLESYRKYNSSAKNFEGKKIKGKKLINLKELAGIIEPYSHLKNGDHEMLEINHFEDLLLELYKKKYNTRILGHVIMFDFAAREDFSGYEEVLKSFLEINEEGSNEGELVYNAKKKSLSLKNITMDSKSWKKLMLFNQLPVEYLDLRNTKTYELRTIPFRNIKSLDIRDTLLVGLDGLKFFKNLKVVYITKGQFPLNSKNKTSRNLNIIEK